MIHTYTQAYSQRDRDRQVHGLPIHTHQYNPYMKAVIQMHTTTQTHIHTVTHTRVTHQQTTIDPYIQAGRQPNRHHAHITIYTQAHKHQPDICNADANIMSHAVTYTQSDNDTHTHPYRGYILYDCMIHTSKHSYMHTGTYIHIP